VKFWNKFLNLNLLKAENIILRGNLTFSLGNVGVWGPSTQVDSLLEYFMRNLENVGLFGIDPFKLKPTWRNKRVDEGRVAKILDIFVLS